MDPGPIRVVPGQTPVAGPLFSHFVTGVATAKDMAQLRGLPAARQACRLSPDPCPAPGSKPSCRGTWGHHQVSPKGVLACSDTEGLPIVCLRGSSPALLPTVHLQGRQLTCVLQVPCGRSTGLCSQHGTSDGPGARRGPARRDSQQAFPVGGFPGCPVGFTVSTQHSSAVLTSLMHRFRKICFQMQNVGLLAGSSQREESVRSKTEHLCKIRARRTRSWPGQLCSELSFSADPFLGTSCSPWRPLAGVPGMDRWRPRRL